MATPIFNNIISEEQKAKSYAKTALKKAYKQEEEKTKKGWRFIKLNERLQVFVPCDKKGKPTQEGLRLIQKQKELHGIK